MLKIISVALLLAAVITTAACRIDHKTYKIDHSKAGHCRFAHNRSCYQ